MLDALDLTQGLLAFAQAAQAGLLQLLHALGLAGEMAGQPAWPFQTRLAVETWLMDRGLARQVATCLLLMGLALGLAALGSGWRRARWPAWAVAGAMLLLAPWPPRTLLLADAVPTSFHRAPPAFDATAITQGLALYQRHCLACHGADGRGEGPSAAGLPVWPPTLSAGLLWKRAEGELLWRVLHGMHDRQGQATMPGFSQALSPQQAWAVLAGMRALAAGESLRREATWPWPVQAPGFEVACGSAPARPLRHWQGQRLRIVAAGSAAALPAEDPRVVTVVLRPGAAGPQPDCVAVAPDAAWAAYARVAGVAAADLSGTQFIVDRAGWLRAIGRPGEAGWSAGNLLCRSDSAEARDDGLTEDGLGALITRMDADPVRSARLGFPHGS